MRRSASATLRGMTARQITASAMRLDGLKLADIGQRLEPPVRKSAVCRLLHRARRNLVERGVSPARVAVALS